MLQVLGVGVAIRGVTEGGVEGSAAVELVVPGHRMRVARGGAVVAALVDGDQYVGVGVDRAEVVPFVGALPGRVEVLRGGVAAIDDVQRGLLNPRMFDEVSTHQFAVPRPAVFRIGGGVHADVAAARLDEALEIGLLFVVQNVAGGVEKNNRRVLLEVLLREGSGILGRVDIKPAFVAEASDGLDAVLD